MTCEQRTCRCICTVRKSYSLEIAQSLKALVNEDGFDLILNSELIFPKQRPQFLYRHVSASEAKPEALAQPLLADRLKRNT